MDTILQNLTNILYTIPGLLLALTIHELSHGYVSYKLGDPTPKYDGRLTLNPLKHLDPIGTIALLIFHFGWAKPVMVNPSYYKNPKRDMAIVAIAGPVSNFIMAFIGYIMFGIYAKFVSETQTTYFFAQMINYFVIVNIGLGIFNLIPLPPLDGSKVLAMFLPDRIYYKYMEIERYGMMILVFLLAFNVGNSFLSVAMQGAIGVISFVGDFVLKLFGI